MNLFQFYEKLELALQYGLDVSSIPNGEVKELHDNIKDVIKEAREYETIRKACQILPLSPAGGTFK